MKELIKLPYFKLKWHMPVWRWLNRRAISLFKAERVTLNPLQTRLLHDLTMQGIAFTTLSELFPQGEYSIEKFSKIIEPLLLTAETKTKKTIYQMLWDPNITINMSDQFLRFATSKTILDVVNSYMGMWSRFKHYTAARTPAIFEGVDAVQSQRWHRDPEEQVQCKVFIYLTDVDETSGPFTYLKGSTVGNRYGSLFPQEPPRGIYPEVGAVEKSVDQKDISVATGPAGTVIFCNTSGLHKGGYATKKDRILFTASFASSTYSVKRWNPLPENWSAIKKDLPAAVVFALDR